MDSIISLAFSLHTTRGAYALLIGSGVSRASGIPTGWEVVLDLINKLAHVLNEGTPSDPEAWHREKYQQEPNYTDLIEKLAPSIGDRQALLRSYFEPTPDERDAGLKLPTAAHHAIAELVELGYIRVILTTNFDRLIESALEARGIAPTVIASPDQAEGSLPLAHSRITIIKIHGDYLDPRIKNTSEELAGYDHRFNKLLDQVFDEYGLLTSGWSAEWDTALRAAIERTKNRRFTFYFSSRGQPQTTASSLITLRGGITIPIDTADSFFVELKEKLLSLETLKQPHPTSRAVAVTSLKRYISDARHQISLHDLVVTEAQQLQTNLRASGFNLDGPPTGKAVLDRIRQYEALSATAEALFTVASHWGNAEQHGILQKALKAATNTSHLGGLVIPISLLDYPALRLLYAGGIAAITNRRYDALAALLLAPAFNLSSGRQASAAQVLSPARINEANWAQTLPGFDNRYTPLSDHLFDTLRPAFESLLIDDTAYENSFNEFEYLRSLVQRDLNGNGGSVGRFAWKWTNHWQTDISRFEQIKSEAQQAGPNWPPLLAGLFGGDLDRFLKVETGYRESIARLNWH